MQDILPFHPHTIHSEYNVLHRLEKMYSEFCSNVPHLPYTAHQLITSVPYPHAYSTPTIETLNLNILIKYGNSGYINLFYNP